MAEVTGELHSLNDTDFETRDPAEDIRDNDVVDTAGEKIGHVSDLFVDAADHKVRLLEVSHGGLLGIGAEKILIPVEAITAIAEDKVYIDRTREHVSGSPVYDPEVGEKQDYYENLYGYYGYAPYWGPRSAYPPFPYY